MADSGDGRLELDELGSVIDHASSLDPGPSEDLLEGPDRTTWGERLESAGITPWMRGHRVLLAASAAVVLVAGIAATTYLRGRPPEPATTVAVGVVDWLSDQSEGGGVGSDGAGTLIAGYRAVPQRDGTTVRILGLEGPGIRASVAHAQSDAPAEDGSAVAVVAAVVGCDDTGTELATADDYRLRVQQTDAYGRSVTGLVTLPPMTAGMWADTVAQPCFVQQVAEHVVPTGMRISGDPATRTITARVLLHNGQGNDLDISAPAGQQTSVFVSADVAVAPSGTDVEFPVRFRVNDCSDPRLDEAYDPSVVGYGRETRRPGLDLFASLSYLDHSNSTTFIVPFTTEQTREVDSWLERICEGTPAVTTDVLLAGRSPIDPAVEFTPNGDPSVVGLRLAVDVATSAERVELRDGIAPEEMPTITTMSDASSTVARGHARLTVDWAVPCSNVASPPTVQLMLTSGSRSWPVRAVLADKQLQDAYLVACPGLVGQDLVGMGWPNG